MTSDEEKLKMLLYPYRHCETCKYRDIHKFFTLNKCDMCEQQNPTQYRQKK